MQKQCVCIYIVSKKIKPWTRMHAQSIDLPEIKGMHVTHRYHEQRLLRCHICKTLSMSLEKCILKDV